MDLVGFGSTLSDEFGANAVGRLYILLLHNPDCHKPHARSAHGFADRFGIIGIVLVAF
jgi:hypothetical protein